MSTQPPPTTTVTTGPTHGGTFQSLMGLPPSSRGPPPTAPPGIPYHEVGRAGPGGLFTMSVPSTTATAVVTPIVSVPDVDVAGTLSTPPMVNLTLPPPSVSNPGEEPLLAIFLTTGPLQCNGRPH